MVEGLSIKKDQPSFTDFKFINKTLHLNEENAMVTEVGTDEPSKDKNLSFAGMELNDQNKRMDVDKDGNIVWSVDNKYCYTDSWSKS